MARIMPAGCHVIAIIVWAAMASAASPVGPAFQLVAQSQMQESLPAISLDASGGVAIWDDNASRAGRFESPQPIAKAMQLAEGPYRDSGAASIGGESLV